MSDPGSTVPAGTKLLRPDDAGIAEAAAILRAGGLVAFPTETVYGLGGDATDPAAVAGIYAAKARPSFNPLIAHVHDAAAARIQGVFGDEASRLADAFWPGPLTLVVPASAETRVCDLARAGLPSVALRVPDDDATRALLAAFGRPLAGPSANRSGRVSPTRAAHVLADLDGRIAAVLDGGDTQVGLESTVIACLAGPARLLRPGGITRDRLRAILGYDPAGPETTDAEAPVGPGLLASHYAPNARVRLDVTRVAPGEALLLFGSFLPEGQETARARLNLSPAGNPAEAAARLFGALRELDASGAPTIAVAPIPPDGLGEAIRDRLVRAAAPR
ncbi:L-threonylcarbamoyladenylate synthase [Methylobacterium persicinum]|uniref:Threonylcarbamoyl-AMP synthase n=1 Tax=Methylobacterium persicinum TaxID=374426 RepID=A0ABU0HTG5_9HYPH|nr:L-threonylcarbamoyladenylate synthase [Methylobacterium persicinum]MDQ0444776.1 L-threonylcarbamoyladenylate synthase [Methylobacterium persicinum]GJE38121.1 Threonylcarbamoyl-AMP synthase [Methylobacterium persicinum]